MLAFMVVGVIVLMLLDVPVAIALAAVTIVFFLAEDIPLASFVQMTAKGVDSYTLLALPFFILTAKLMNASAATDKLLDLGLALVGWMRGGLAQANVMASFLFAGISGSAVADAGGLGAVEMRAMQRAGYSRGFALGVTAASSTVGPIIPPSVVMIVYGIASGTPIGALFIGGLVPGILMAIVLMGLTSTLAQRETAVPTRPFSAGVLWHALGAALPALMTPVIVVAGILSGAFTATESGAIAAFYAILSGQFGESRLTPPRIWMLLKETMLESGGILFIMAAAAAFSWALAFEQAPQGALMALTALTESTIVLLILLAAMYLALGCFIEAIAIITMTVPILLPVLVQYGIDPVHFGVILALLMSIGTITPPLGIVMFTLCRITGIGVPEFSRAIWPWLIALIGVTLALIFIPELVLWLPKSAGLWQ